MNRVRVGVVDQGREEKLERYLACLRACDASGAPPEIEVLRWSGDAAADAARFDALVLCGGDDVDARLWGEQNHPSVELVPPIRDRYEIALVRAAAARDVPLLGVCRGSQVMNVALGGSLVQHVPDLPGAGTHGGGARHRVSIEEGSLLRSIAGAGSGDVNTWHHQAVGRLGRGVRAVARAADGVVEAVEGPGRFCLGVQWHPEREGNDGPLAHGVFAALVAAAGNHGTSGRR